MLYMQQIFNTSSGGPTMNSVFRATEPFIAAAVNTKAVDNRLPWQVSHVLLLVIVLILLFIQVVISQACACSMHSSGVLLAVLLMILLRLLMVTLDACACSMHSGSTLTTAYLQLIDKDRASVACAITGIYYTAANSSWGQYVYVFTWADLLLVWCYQHYYSHYCAVTAISQLYDSDYQCIGMTL
jgi:hypothetical protein